MTERTVFERSLAAWMADETSGAGVRVVNVIGRRRLRLGGRAVEHGEPRIADPAPQAGLGPGRGEAQRLYGRGRVRGGRVAPLAGGGRPY